MDAVRGADLIQRHKAGLHMGVTWNRWSHSSIYNKNDANNIFSGWYKIGFEIKNEIEGQCQSSPKFSGILRVLRCIFGPNFEILSWIGGEWWHGQAQNMVIFHFEVKFDLEVQSQLPPKTIGILTKVFCSSGSNLVILAWTGDKLSRGQASDYRTHRRTHRQTQATTIPEGQNWPRVKTFGIGAISALLSPCKQTVELSIIWNDMIMTVHWFRDITNLHPMI